MRWWQRRSLRIRLLLISIVGLCLGFLLGGLALVAALGFVLQRSVDADAGRTAAGVAALVNAGAVPQPLPVAGPDRVQVIDERGRVRSASIDADQLVSMLNPAELARARAGEKLLLQLAAPPGPVRVVAVPAGPPDDPQTVVVARSMSDALRGIGLLRTILLVLFPLLVMLLATVAWRVIGATLRPVEALRQGAEEITGRSARLPVPAGTDEIHRLAVTLNGMLDRLESGRARQREFVADAAHELRSPLANMKIQLEVAKRLGTGADWPMVVDDVLADTTRLATLVDDLLLLARSDETSGLNRAGPVELGSLVRMVADRYPTVHRVADTSALWTHGEPEALGRVVSNLLDNAVRHARTSVTVGLHHEESANRSPRWCVLTVTDDGPGIAVADRARVFERFVRLDDARARDASAPGEAGGAGLGLAIVAELVRRHGGSVTLADAGPGLRVRVRLPAIDVGAVDVGAVDGEP